MASNKVKTLKNQRSGDHLVIDKFTYEIKRKNIDSIKWYCTQWRVTRCNAQVKTSYSREVLIQKGVVQFLLNFLILLVLLICFLILLVSLAQFPWRLNCLLNN